MSGTTITTIRWESTGPYEVVFTTRLGGVSDGPFDSLNLGHRTGDSTENVVERARLSVCDGNQAPLEIFDELAPAHTARRRCERAATYDAFPRVEAAKRIFTDAHRERIFTLSVAHAAAVRDLHDLILRRNDSLRPQEAEAELAVVTRRAHRDHERIAVDEDRERLFADHEIGDVAHIAFGDPRNGNDLSRTHLA